MNYQGGGDMLTTKLPDAVLLDRNEVEALLLYSVRYSLGRMSYAVSDVANMVKKYKKFLTDNTKSVILESIKDQEHYGMDMDKETWMILKTVLEEDLANVKSTRHPKTAK